MTHRHDGYSSVWSFRVKAGCELEFLRHYAPDGTWGQLFAQGAGYRRTRLLQDRSDPRRFCSIDDWESELAYHEFRARFAAHYDDLDRACAALTEWEEPVGEYVEVDPPRG